MKNIEIGIDLGTTNSEISIFNNGKVEVVKNTFGSEFTPSVFGVNKAKNEEVGRNPYNRYFKDSNKDEILNNKPEIKRLMGTSDTIYFPRIDKSYNAEEISSKILSALKQDAVRKKQDINTNAAVITIPAYFSTLQAEATKRAGILAGFEYVVLLQEPIAAAISYGFANTESGSEVWLVYDFGGGTFDSALISSKDKNLSILSHNGDNFLGGKDIDNLIVNKLIVPFLKDKYNLTNFERSNEKYSLEFAKLKYFAEQAKIQLSGMETTTIEIDLKIDDNDIYENINISQSQLANLMKDLLTRTIELCRKTISDAGVENSSVNKIIFVGGPTQLPFIRTTLEKELNIKVDTSSDPLTAVSRGACIFAISQNIPQEFQKVKEIDSNTYEIQLNYDSLTGEENQLITGLIAKLKDKEEDYFIQIQSEDNTFNTGKIKINNGKFVANINIKPNMLNVYWIYLFDKDGTTLSLSTDSFNITHGLTISGTPIPHSIGISYLDKDIINGTEQEKFDIFFNKNSIIPLSETRNYKTTKLLKKGSTENCLPITVYEGESENPSRNVFVCELALTGEKLDYDLPKGSDIDVMIKIDSSRNLTLEAYIPIMDKTLNIRATAYDEEISVSEMNNNVLKEENRFKKLKEVCSDEEKEKFVERINDLKQSIQNSKNDNDEKRKTNVEIKKLQTEIDNLEKNRSLEVMQKQFNTMCTDIYKFIEQISQEKEKQTFKDRYTSLKNDGLKAIENNDRISLSNVIESLRELGQTVLLSNKYAWLSILQDLSKKKEISTNPEAMKYIEQGYEAFKEDDIETLQQCVHNCYNLLPKEEQGIIENKIPGITKQ